MSGVLQTCRMGWRVRGTLLPGKGAEGELPPQGPTLALSSASVIAIVVGSPGCKTRPWPWVLPPPLLVTAVDVAPAQ